MSDNRRDSQGTELQMGDGASPETFTVIGELADIPEIPEEYSERDRTTLADTARKIHHGFPLLSKFDIQVADSLTDSVQAAMTAAARAKTEHNFRAYYPDSPAKTYGFTAKILKWTPPFGGVDSDLNVKWTLVKTSLFSDVT